MYTTSRQLHFSVTVPFTLWPYFLFSLVCCCHCIVSAQLKCLLHGHRLIDWLNSLFSFIMVKCLVKWGLQFTLLLTTLQTLELQEAICQSLMAFCHKLETVVLHHLAREDQMAIDAYVAVATPHQSSSLPLAGVQNWPLTSLMEARKEVLSSVSRDASSTSALSQHWKFPLIEKELKLFAASSPELFSRKSWQHQWLFITEKQSWGIWRGNFSQSQPLKKLLLLPRKQHKSKASYSRLRS